jgi:hypothetical protein
MKMMPSLPCMLPTIQRSLLAPPYLLYNLTNLPPPACSVSLKDLDRNKLIQWLYSLEHPPPAGKDKLAPTPLLCMTQDDIIQLLHHSCTTLPQVHPYDTPNESDMKLHWTVEELHQVMGCHQFRNYKHLMAVTKSGRFLDTGKFRNSIGAYTTVP